MKKQLYSKSIGLISLILVAFQLSLLTSCDEWLDVKPKTQIESTDMFSTETGFKDALNGVYIKMSTASMYGREMTYGFLDVIGDAYYSVYSNAVYSAALQHNYTYTGVETMINNIWQNSYNAIATLNEFINQIEAADKASFSRDNYNVLKGEAYGLRAFLHFDLLRLFAKSPAADPNAEAIPYVTTYSFQITPSSTVSATLDQVIADLNTAADLLKQSDPIATGREITASDDNGYLMDRQFHMNYYAVKAILARAYLYKGDTNNARQCAQEVISSGKFTWTPVESIATANDSERDRTFTHEQVFALQCDNLYSYVDPTIWGSSLAYSARLVLYSSWLTKIWPTNTHATDWRYVYFMTNQ
ncbi:MAG: RagB/SusD family nutrient uptake outer membrane protein, partial [Prevotella sp.]|nr:RagB/SusD family nutrient uptake outer membrane protein [Prevotella sp.]